MPHDARRAGHCPRWFGSFLGSAALLAALAPCNLAQEVIYRNQGQTGHQLGQAATSIGDLDGDGVDDFLVVSPHAQKGLGRIRARSGATLDRLFKIVGPAQDPDWDWGINLSSAGDVDGDGLEDVLIGMPNTFVNRNFDGAFSVYSSGTQALLYSFVGSGKAARLGSGVCSLADIDGDGRDDFVVGSSGDTNAAGAYVGSVTLYSGANASVLYRLEGNGIGAFGSTVENMPDVDGDGVPELLIGATDYSDPGSVHVHSGATGNRLYSVQGLLPGDGFGETVAGLSDVDGDGRGDFLIGASERGNGNGYAQLRSGADGTLLFFASGAAPMDYFGAKVEAAGDVNGDGVEDFLIAATQDGQSTRVGYVRLYSGKTLGLLYEFEGDQEHDLFGSEMAALGDLDGDGLGEILIAAPFAGSLYSGYGWYEVYAGNDLYLNASPNLVGAGDTLYVTIGEAAAWSPTVEFVTRVNGVPILQPYRFWNVRQDGRSLTIWQVPPGLTGNTIRLRAYALGPSGNVIDSANEVLQLQ